MPAVPPPPPGFQFPPPAVPPVAAPPPAPASIPAAPAPVAARPTTRAPRQQGRNALAAVLAIVAAGAIAASVVLAWVDGQILNGPRFVTTSAPAATDPATTTIVSGLLVDGVGATLRPIVEAPREDGTIADVTAFEAALEAAAGQAATSQEWVALWGQGWAAQVARTQALLDGAPPTQAELDGTAVTFALDPLAVLVRDQVALAGFPEVAGQPVATPPLTVRTTSTLADELDTVAAWDGRWWLVLLGGVVAAAAAFAASTRRERLALLLGADLIVGGAAVWLFATLAGDVAGERGLDESSRTILSATYVPFGDLLARNGVITALVGAGVLVLGVVAVVAIRSQQRRVRSGPSSASPDPSAPEAR
jgi:hypothetical protein